MRYQVQEIAQRLPDHAVRVEVLVIDEDAGVRQAIACPTIEDAVLQARAEAAGKDEWGNDEVIAEVDALLGKHTAVGLSTADEAAAAKAVKDAQDAAAAKKADEAQKALADEAKDVPVEEAKTP